MGIDAKYPHFFISNAQPPNTAPNWAEPASVNLHSIDDARIGRLAMVMQLQLQTRVDVEAYLRLSRRVIVPIGSTEQRGPIGLIGTGAICTQVIARGVGEAAAALVTATLAVGMAQHCLGFAGSMALVTEYLDRRSV